MSDTATQPHVDGRRGRTSRPRRSPPGCAPPCRRSVRRPRAVLAGLQRAGPRAGRGRALPLLERARFLAIFASNLDEFFMVRVAGLKRRIDAGIAVRAACGLMPRDLLELILSRTRLLMDRQAACFADSVLPRPAGRGHPAAALPPGHDDERAQLQRSSSRRCSRS